MAAINSLTYFLFSVLSLAANNKPTTDPSLSAWQIDSEPPVTKWEQESRYINEEVDPDEIVSAEKDPEIPDESGGCPSPIECSKSCKRQGYKNGLCSGPYKRNCLCFRKLGAEDSEGPRVDPDEIVSAEKDPEIPEESGGCPKTIECSKSCKRQGYKYGLCSGPDKRNCHCYRNWGAEYTEGPRADPDEIVSAEKDPEIPFGRFSSTGGCPDKNACNRYCRPKRGHCAVRSFCICEWN